MNVFVRALGRVCQSSLLQEKWLVAPSLRTGHQWLDCAARAGHAVVNVRITTVKGLALELAAPILAEKKVSLAGSQGSAILIDAMLNRPAGEQRGYLSSLQPSPGLSQTIFAALDAIRLAGLDAEDLRPGAFEVDGKAQDLARLLGEYLGRLEALQLVDYAAVLVWAAARLKQDGAALPSDAVVLLPEDLDLTALERALVDAIPAAKRRTIPVDRPQALPEEEAGPAGPAYDSLLLRWLPSPADAPQPKQDGSAAIFRAVGEVNEVREVLRRVLGAGCALDEVELLHTDTDTYVPLCFELAWRLQAETDGPEAELPMTFAEGIPARYTRPGRALVAWLTWLREGYSQHLLVRMLQDGLIDLPDRENGEQNASPQTGAGAQRQKHGHGVKQNAREPASVSGQHFSLGGLAALLRSVGIGMGRRRYADKLAEQIAGCKRQLDAPGRGEDEREDAAGSHRAALSRRLEGLTLLNALVAQLLALAPPLDAAPQEVLDAALRFLEQMARSVNELDNYARRSLIEEIQQMRRWLQQAGSPLSHDLWEWLLSLAGQVRVAGSGPRPGRLHVAHVQSGGHSGRPTTFLIGLDDGRFPGAGLQDPLLLDHERRELSTDLTTAAGQMQDRLDDFTRLLARLRGRVTLSYSCHDLVDDREMFPSPAVLSAYRILSGKRDGDQSDLLAWLAPPASFAPADDKGCLDEAEWWMWRLCGLEPVDKVAELVAGHFPHLDRGRQAAAARAAPEFSVFDGLVPEAGRDFDPTKPHGPVLSASGLETIGRCPLSYFFRYALKIEPPEELAIDANQWLSPPDFGSLLHEVFRAFLSGLRKADRLPNLARDLPALMEALDREVAAWRDRCPPPSESVYRAQYRQLREAARIFLAGEEEACQQYRPQFMEAALGMSSPDEPTPLDDREPIPIRLPGGDEFRARGRIDRVDRLGPESAHEYAVWDYKTGSTWKFRTAKNYATGRIVQPSLYRAMVETALRRKIDPRAVVRLFGYYFPTVQGQGDRLFRSEEELAAGQAVLERLCRIVAAGAFPATSDVDDCAYCDYAPVCRNPQAVAERSQVKLDDPVNESLRPFRELRNDE